MEPGIGEFSEAIRAPRRKVAAQNNFAQPRAFTLVELLVVMLIVALLAALFLPSLCRGRGRAQGVSCFNNLRQLQLGWISYEADHNEHFPPNISIYAYGRALNISNSWVLGNAQRDESTGNLMGGSLYAYVPAVGSYLCPSDRAKTKGSSPRLHTRSYSVQWWLGAEFTVNGQVWADPNPRGQVQKWSVGQIAAPGPAEIFALIDDHEQSVDDGIFVIGGCEWFDYPADRHRRGANLSFLDGHVEGHRWVIAKVVPWDWTYYLNPVWSREVPDHAWLAAHLPTR